MDAAPYQYRELCKVVKLSAHLVDAVRLPEVVEVLGPLAAAHHHPQVHRTVLDNQELLFTHCLYTLYTFQ